MNYGWGQTSPHVPLAGRDVANSPLPAKVSIFQNIDTYVARNTFIETEVFSIERMKPFKNISSTNSLHCGWKNIPKKVKYEGGLSYSHKTF